ARSCPSRRGVYGRFFMSEQLYVYFAVVAHESGGDDMTVILCHMEQFLYHVERSDRVHNYGNLALNRVQCLLPLPRPAINPDYAFRKQSQTIIMTTKHDCLRSAMAQ